VIEGLGDVAADGDEHDLAAGIVNPRLSDVFGLVIRQDEVDFVVPHLREDLPLYLDPFLLWKSDDPEYRRLHAGLLGFVDEVRQHAVDGRATRAGMLLSEVSEPVELGLGYAAGTKRGSALGPGTIDGIVRTFQQVPQLQLIKAGRIGTGILGPSGRGKSTLLDAMAAVIMPNPQEFNQAARDDQGRKRERTVYTYARGLTVRHQDEHGHSTTPSYLRPPGSAGFVSGAAITSHGDGTEQDANCGW